VQPNLQKNSFYLIKKETIMPNPIQRPNSPQRRVISTSGNSGGNRNNNRGGGNNNNQGGGNNNNPPLPSPWLDGNNPPTPDPTASFVEYIRWMRSPDHQYKDATKTQILQLATEKAKNGYNERLKLLNERLKLMTDNIFQIKSTWRIRVGGHRGAENILLPAFDHLGIPFIPSASLKGVARNQAIRELMKKENIDYKKAEKHPEITKHFGNLDGENSTNNAGQIIFFDAYPLPNQYGLTMDMANNIWNWEGNNLNYSPNPNVFLSLKEPTFLIGLKLASNQTDVKLLEQVKQWLIKALESGIGSQINTGYGQLITAGKQPKTNEFLRVDFALEGQLIHSYQSFTQWNWNDRRNEYQMRGKAEPEVRPIAFKSMLRYWFRAFALGVLPVDDVKTWEATLFGGINPQKNGYLKVNLFEGKETQKEPKTNRDNCGKQEGILTLSLSNQVPENQIKTITNLLKTVTWFMFNMGGIGQGARRPLYARNKRQNPRPPYYRGVSLYSENEFLDVPETEREFKQVFKKHLLSFYNNLQQLTNQNINHQQLRTVGEFSRQNWSEAIDKNCRIVVVFGQENYGKCYALSILHSETLKRNGNYDGDLCGFTRGNNVKPSPVWIADLGDYQIVTVFGATENPREKYLEELKNQAEEFVQIFPFQ
jgi:CRISPR-associated protein Cmr6